MKTSGHFKIQSFPGSALIRSSVNIPPRGPILNLSLWKVLMYSNTSELATESMEKQARAMNLLGLGLRHNLVNCSVNYQSLNFFDLDFLYLYNEVLPTPTFCSSCGESQAVVSAESCPVHHQVHCLTLATTLAPVDSSKSLLLWS